MLHLNIRKTIGLKAEFSSAALPAVGAENFQPTRVHQNDVPVRRRLTAAGALTLAAALITAIGPVSRADSNGGALTFGPPDGLHIVVAGDTSTGYRAELYDANQFVTGRGLTGKYDLTVFAGTSANQPTGPDLLTDPTAASSWQGPFQNGVGSVPGSVTTATAPGGAPAIQWTMSNAAPQTWIQIPMTNLASGSNYFATVTLQGNGTVFLDFYDGQVDNQSAAVTLSSQPVTLKLTVTIPNGPLNTPQFQVRTSAQGPVNLLVSAAAVQVGTPIPPTSANLLSNRYRSIDYNASTATLTLSGAVDQVGPATVTRSETYRFVSPYVIDAQVTTGTAGSPVVFWYTPYTSFHTGWQPLWVGGNTSSYESPNSDSLKDSPLPAVGVSDGVHTYGIAAASTWDEPMPGYSGPHLIINGERLAAPQIGTQSFPVALNTGESRSFRTVFFRGASGPYGLALSAELAMARTLGLSGDTENRTGPSWDQNVPETVLRSIAQQDFVAIAKVNAYWLREGTSNGGFALAPSQHYGTSTYARDSFWTTYGLQGTPFQAETETTIFGQFTNAIPSSGSNAGHVPVTSGGPFFFDESGLYYLIRMYRDSALWGLPVKNVSTAQLVLNYIQSNQVSNGQFLTAGPINNAGFEITPDTWLDGYLFPVGAVSAYNQGLYVVALEACQKLGLAVTDDEIAAALAVYRGLYDPNLGYVRWLSTKTYKGPDVLVGDALSLFLWNRPLLADDVVRNTLAVQVRTPYGVEVLAKQDGSSVPAGEFLTLTNNPTTGAVEGIPEPGGWYQNGGSWLLWEFLAEYAAARHGERSALGGIQESLAAEVAVTPLSKEFKVTQNNPAIATVDPAWPYPLGSCGLDRQGFGWNSAVAAFLSTLP
jgi:hypothetical protein